MGFSVRRDLNVEELDQGYLVLDGACNRVYHLTDDRADAFASARRGTGNVPDHLAPAMAGLIELGIVECNSWTRRKVLQLGGVAAAAGVATLALPGIAAAASHPGTSTPPSGSTPNLYIGNGNGQSVSKWDPATGTLTTVIDDSRLFGPWGMAWRDDVLYIGTFDNTVMAWDSTTGDLTTAVSGTLGADAPHGLAWHDDLLYICYFEAGAVRTWNPVTDEVDDVVTELHLPSKICWQDDILYISSEAESSVSRWDLATGQSLARISGFAGPVGMAWRDGILYVANLSDATVSAWNPSVPATVTTVVPGIAGLESPRGMAWHDDLLYIASSQSNEVFTFDPSTGDTDTVIAADAGLNYPTPLAWH